MRRIKIKGFTLVELLVVIAIISMLVTVMVPVALSLFKGKGLAMAGNNLGGFVAFARTEAMNTRRTHVVVFYSEVTDISDPDSNFALEVGPGLVLWRINPMPKPGSDMKEVEFVKQLDFGANIGGNVDFDKDWLSRTERVSIPELGDRANEKFRQYYKIAIRADGRLVIPGDKNGYALDSGDLSNLDADIILSDDSENYMFVDFNPATGAVKSTPVYSAEDLGK